MSCTTTFQLNNQLKNSSPQYAAIPYGRMEYYRLGQGSPIVLIPGYLMDISSWDRRFLASLASNHELIIFNHRNVGGSFVHANQGDSHDLARDLHYLIHKLGLRKPAILGISMGGMVAQQFAVSYPKQLSKLILVNTAIAGQQSVHPAPYVKQLMFNMPSSKLQRYLVARKLFFPASQRFPMGISLISNRFQPKQYIEINPSAVISQQRTLVQHWLHDDATAKKLARLNLPVLILSGGKDLVIPPINSAILAKTIPQAQLKCLEKGGHAMIYQYPLELANIIHAFILGESYVLP